MYNWDSIVIKGEYRWRLGGSSEYVLGCWRDIVDMMIAEAYFDKHFTQKVFQTTGAEGEDTIVETEI